MNYLSISFLLFLPIFLIVYYLIPCKYRYIAIFAGSYIFYGFSNCKMLLVLLLVTVITYVAGILIENMNSKLFLFLSIASVVLILVFFKYTNFIINIINLFLTYFSEEMSAISEKSIIYPVGLSFIAFQVITYLSDVYKNAIKAEKNIIRYASFVAFFPTVLSGPIQKSRELIPQIRNPKSFDFDQAKKGTMLFVWGIFEKVMVANKLLIIVDKVYGDYTNFNSAYYIIAAVAFSGYIYADFSSYSDMARGIAKLMGIEITKNFNNPYFSQTTSEFWNRWHVSLNSWLLENIYIPLGGNRKGTFRKYINIFIVFAISGLWHGANFHYVVWGIINGLIVILGQILKPLRNKIYAIIKVDEKCESIIFCKRLIVFCLISLTWVFFDNSVYTSLYIIKNIIICKPINFFDQNLLSISGTVMATFVTIICCYIFYKIQKKRTDEAGAYKIFCKQPVLFQSLLIAFLIVMCVFSMFATDATVNAQFLYFQF